MKDWGHPDAQGDPVEFHSFLIRGLNLTGFDMSWEQRVQLGQEVTRNDQNSAHQPLIMQIDEELCNDSHLTLNQLIRTWMNQLGIQTAMLHDTTLICLHIDRYGDGTVAKCDTPIGVHGSVSIPFYVGSGLDVSWRGYQVISMVSHQGQDEAGHCRSLLKTWPDTQSTQGPVLHLLTDDNGPSPSYLARATLVCKQCLQAIFASNVWLDLLRLPPMQSTGVGQQPRSEMDGQILPLKCCSCWQWIRRKILQLHLPSHDPTSPPSNGV